MSEIDKWMSNEHWSSDTDWGKPKYLGKLLSQCNFVHHKFHVDWSGIKWRPSWWEASTEPPEQWHSCSNSQVRIVNNICTGVLNRLEEARTLVKIELTVRPETHICIQASFRSMCPSSGRSSSHCPPCTVLANMNIGQFPQCCGSVPAQTCHLLCLDVHTVPLKHKLLYGWTTKLSQGKVFNIIHRLWYRTFYFMLGIWGFLVKGKGEVKVNFTQEQVMEVQIGNRGIALLFL